MRERMPSMRRVEVGDYRGQALFYVNNEPFFLMEAGILHVAGQAGKEEEVACEVIRRAQVMGLNTIEIGVDWSYLAEEEEYEPLFARMDRLIDRVVEGGFYASMRIRAEYRPAWYNASFVTDRQGRTDEPFVTFLGEDFAGRAARYMQAVARHYSDHPYVLCMTIGFGCEAMNRYPGRHLDWTDYSPEGKAAFRRYVEKAYDRDIEKVNKAWDTSYDHLDAIEPPDQNLDTRMDRYALDFKAFRMASILDLSQSLLRAVRPEVPRRPLGTFIEGGASYPSNIRGSNPPAWVSLVDFSKIPNNYFDAADKVIAHRHTTSSFLKQKMLINELTTGAHNATEGATYAFLETLQQPSCPSFIFLQSFNPETLRQMPEMLTFIRDHYQNIWGRDAQVALLDNTRGANLGTTLDDILFREHEHIACHLMKRGVCFDAVYPERLDNALAAEQYALLLVSPLHLLSPEVLRLLRDYRGHTAMILCLRDDASPTLLIDGLQVREVSAPELERQLQLSVARLDTLDLLSETGKALVRHGFKKNPGGHDLLDAVLNRLQVRSVHTPGLEGTFVHEGFYVGRAYQDLDPEHAVVLRGTRPPENGFVLQARDLSLKHLPIQWTALSVNQWSGRLSEPICQHDMVVLLNERK